MASRTLRCRIGRNPNGVVLIVLVCTVLKYTIILAGAEFEYPTNISPESPLTSGALSFVKHVSVNIIALMGVLGFKGCKCISLKS